MRKGLPGALGSKDPNSAPSSQYLFPSPARPREEIQCCSSKPARRVASAGLTQESKGGMVPRPLRWARREGKGREQLRGTPPTSLAGDPPQTTLISRQKGPWGSHCLSIASCPITSRSPSTPYPIIERHTYYCGTPCKKLWCLWKSPEQICDPTIPPSSSPTSARKKP